MTLLETIGDSAWMSANRDRLREIFPASWTHMQNLNGLGIAFQLKLVGVNWRDEQEFGKVLVFLERVGILQRDAMLVRRSPW